VDHPKRISDPFWTSAGSRKCAERGEPPQARFAHIQEDMRTTNKKSHTEDRTRAGKTLCGREMPRAHDEWSAAASCEGCARVAEARRAARLAAETARFVAGVVAKGVGSK